MQLSVLLLNYKNPEELIRNIEAHIKWCSPHDTEFIIVNNAKDEENRLKKLLSDYSGKINIKTIYNDANRYFGPGLNQAAEQAKGDYLLIINADAYFDDAVSLPTLIEFLKTNPLVGAAGGRVLDSSTKTITRTSTELPTVFTEFFRVSFFNKLFESKRFAPNRLKNYIYQNWDRNTDRQVGVLCDCFLLIRRELFQKIGGYSPGLLLYYTEEDLAQKIKNAGYMLYHLGQAKVLHEWSTSARRESPDKIKAVFLRDRFRYLKRYHGCFSAWLLSVSALLCHPKYLARAPFIFSWLRRLRKEETVFRMSSRS